MTKSKSYGQLRTIGTTPKQITPYCQNRKDCILRHGLGIWNRYFAGHVQSGLLLFSTWIQCCHFYAAAIVLTDTALAGWIMVSIAIRKPVKIAAGISPIEAVRFTGNAERKVRMRIRRICRLNPLSMGIANFRRDRKKTISIVASLSLGGVILLVTASILLVRSPERIARSVFPGWGL